MPAQSLRIGLFGVGLQNYWLQFPGLRARLENYLTAVEEKLARPDVEVVNIGLVDSPESAFEAGRQMRREVVDIIFLHVTTYALSATVLPVVQRAHVPVVVLNLSPDSKIDYAALKALGNRAAMTGEWLANCSGCAVPEIANVFRRCGIQFHEITGTLVGDPGVWAEVDGWIVAARVAAAMSTNRIGLMGHVYNGMLDIQCDPTLQAATFGGHIEHLEVDELSVLRESVSEDEVLARRREFADEFDLQPDCQERDLLDSARTSVALDRLVIEHGLGSLAYFYKGAPGSANELTIASIILGCSLLTAKHVAVAGEYELKNVQAMKIMDLFGAGGSFTEFYAMDFSDNIVLMGHDGPGHIAIAQGKTKVRPLSVYHGKVGRGVSVEMIVRHGPVTLLSVVEADGGKLALLFAEGESVAGPILEIGNTNSRYRFSCGAREFVQRWNRRGPAHHCAVGVGHVGGRIAKLASLVGIEAIRVT